MKEKATIIFNPISGTSKYQNVQKLIHNNIDKDKYDYEIITTEYAHHAIEITKNSVKNGAKTIIACGGDGSINDCIQEGCLNKDTKLGIIPLGSGNGLSRHLEIPFNIKKAIEVINVGKIRQIDSIKVNNYRYASIAGIGFDALVAYQFSKTNRRGFLSYLKISLQNYPSYKPLKYHIEIDGISIQKEALFISISNSNQFGYNTQIAPKAKLDDGLLDVCIVKKIPYISFPNTLILLVQKKIDKSIYLEHIQAKSIKINNLVNNLINLDGETYQVEAPLDFKIMPLSLNIISP